MKNTFNMFFAELMGRILKQLMEKFLKSLNEEGAVQQKLLDPLKEWAENKFKVNL